MLKDRGETLPLGARLPSKALKKKVLVPEAEESSSGGKAGWEQGGRTGSQKGMSTEGESKLNNIISKHGNYSCFVSSCWGKVQLD